MADRLWVDTISAPARLVEPLAQRFGQTQVVLCAGIGRWAVHSALAAGWWRRAA